MANPNIRLSDGNIKLKGNHKWLFLIWNLPAVRTCPYKTPECERLCYALKAERQYPTCLPSRERHYEETLKESFVDDMIEAIERKLARKSAKGRKTFFRIHESGDFYNVEYARKWTEIARHFIGRKEISFLAYTKSLRFFDKLYVPSNLVIRFSLWDDTKATEVAYFKEKNVPSFTAIPKGEAFDGYICPGDCSVCVACYQGDVFHRIAVHIH